MFMFNKYFPSRAGKNDHHNWARKQKAATMQDKLLRTLSKCWSSGFQFKYQQQLNELEWSVHNFNL